MRRDKKIFMLVLIDIITITAISMEMLANHKASIGAFLKIIGKNEGTATLRVTHNAVF